MADGKWLNESEASVWLGFLRTSTLLFEALDQALRADAGISLAEYEVLAFLDASASGSLRMSDLGSRALVSKTRLTHIIDRLEDSGLVTRVRDDQDGRGIRARITPKGRRLQHRSALGHVRSVRRLLIDHIPEKLHPELIHLFNQARASLADPVQP